MNRKGLAVARTPRRAPMSDREPQDVTAAMDTLVQGYRTESELYTRVRKLTWRQRDTLREGPDLDQFRDLLDEKEDLLKLIGQVETEMRRAKSVVLSREPSQCPDRWRLEMLLERLTATIEEIRILEGANASLLEGALAAG